GVGHLVVGATLLDQIQDALVVGVGDIGPAQVNTALDGNDLDQHRPVGGALGVGDAERAAFDGAGVRHDRHPVDADHLITPPSGSAGSRSAAAHGPAAG